MRRTRRAGSVSLDALICAAVLVGLAAGGYAVVRAGLDAYFFHLGNAVGSPAL